MKELIPRLAYLISTQTKERYKKEYPNTHDEVVERNALVTIKPGSKYIKVDVGDSGKYMVDSQTGDIYGIKAYGQVHKGHYYGTLETIDQYYWGQYTAFKIQSKKGA